VDKEYFFSASIGGNAMQIHRRDLLQLGLAAALISPAAAQHDDDDEFDLGREWQVTEYGAAGRTWEGMWTRRGDSNKFDAEWRDSLTGGIVRDVIMFERLRHNTVILYRYGTNGRYYGELSPHGHRIERGSASWYGPGYYWTARINRGD
jgi:hypothetical protein